MTELHRHTALPSSILPLDWRQNAGSRRSSRIALAVVLSFLLPGLGQLSLGYRRRGLLMIGASLSLIASVMAFGPRDSFEALSLAVQPRFLFGLMVANLALLGFRLFAIYDAFYLAARTTSPVHMSSWSARILLLTLALAAVTPHVAVGYYDYVTYNAVDRLFASNQNKVEYPQPAEVELSRPINFAPGVTPAAPAVTNEENES